jgi:hypothetical protein
MNEGGEVAWDGRKFEDDLTAIQSAFHLVLTVGGWHTFMAEYQNDPIEDASTQYNLNADIIQSRVNMMSRLHVPDGANIIAGFGDINHVGINYAIIAFKHDMTGYIVDYGKFPEGRAVLYDPENSNKTTEAQAITQGIFNFIRLIDSKTYVQDGKATFPALLQIDANYMTNTVYEAIAHAVRQFRPKFTVRANHGRGYTQYRRPRDKNSTVHIGDHCHAEKNKRGMAVIQDSDYWRMTAQKAFLLEPGVPGSLSLYGKAPREHKRIAEEIAGEKLKNYAFTEKGPMYNWTRTPGLANDLMDAVTGCYPAANILGASLTGMEQWRPRKKPRRKPKVSIG